MPLALPTNWTGHSLAVTGTISGFVPRADSPKYIGTGTTVNGYVATDSRVYTITDIGGARTLGTPYVYADGAAVSASQVQIQSERGNPDWCLVAIYYDTLGTRVYRTIDGGATWADESSLPTRYDNNLPNNAGTWAPGLWMNPEGNGNALVSVPRTTASPPGADLYETNDYGETWAQVGTLDLGDFPPGSITKPLNRSDVIFHGYHESGLSAPLPGCGAGTYVWDYTANAYDAYDNSSGSTWTTGQGWYRTSVGAGASNYVIQPCDFSSITSVSVRLTVTGNVSLNFGIGSAPRRVDNTLNDTNQDYTYAASGSGSDVYIYLQMAASTSCYIERVTVVGTRTNCPTDDLECGIQRIIGTTPADITPIISGDPYGVPYATYAQRALSVADGNPNALVLVGYNPTSGKYGVLQTFNALAAAPTWNTIITPETTVKARGAYYTNQYTIYLIGDDGYLARCNYYGGTWAVDAQNGSGAGDLRGLCGL